MTKTLLIAGGSGTVGQAITRLGLEKGYSIRLLTRKKRGIPKVEEFEWNPAKNKVDENAFKGVDAIINLAGAGIADRLWSDRYRKELVSSRLDSTQLLAKKSKEYKIPAFISASAVGYYGHRGSEWVDEKDAPGQGFMANLCKDWEEAALKAHGRVCCLRIGIVLDEHQGALPPLARPCRWGLGAAVGNGHQYMPWIHRDDLAQMFLFAVESDSLSGIFNACAPSPVEQKHAIRSISHQLKRPYFLPNVPAFLLKAILGEMSKVVLEGQRCSCNKIQQQGFLFKYNLFEDAIAELL